MNTKNVILLTVMAVLILTNTKSTQAAEASGVENTERARDYLLEGPLAVPGLPEIFETFAMPRPNDDPVYNQSIQELEKLKSMLEQPITDSGLGFIERSSLSIQKNLDDRYASWLRLLDNIQHKKGHNKELFDTLKKELTQKHKYAINLLHFIQDEIEQESILYYLSSGER
jgi:hypothetical protein